MAILVVNFHQPLEVAWRTTLREFFIVTDFKGETRRRAGQKGWDHNRLDELKAHINALEG